MLIFVPFFKIGRLAANDAMYTFRISNVPLLHYSDASRFFLRYSPKERQRTNGAICQTSLCSVSERGLRNTGHAAATYSELHEMASLQTRLHKTMAL